MLLGIFDNNNKNFFLEPIPNRNAVILKFYISKNVEKGKADGWSDYNFLDYYASRYFRNIYNHKPGFFWYRLKSTLHIESILGKIQAKFIE